MLIIFFGSLNMISFIYNIMCVLLIVTSHLSYAMDEKKEESNKQFPYANSQTLSQIICGNEAQESEQDLSELAKLHALIGGGNMGKLSVLGPSLASKLGNPTIGGNPANFMEVIGGEANTSVAARLGDTTLPTTGLSATINANVAVNTSGIFNTTAFSNFKNASSLQDQLDKLLALFNTVNWATNTNTYITFGPFTSTDPVSLGNIVSKASVTA